MAGGSTIPHALQMKALKYGDQPDSEKDRMAEVLRGEGRRSEAILLFEGRPEHPFLAEERAWAAQEGRAFHLLALRRLGVEVSSQDLKACAAGAEARGRWMEARHCYVELGAEDEIARIAEHLPESLRPEPPPEEPETP